LITFLAGRFMVVNINLDFCAYISTNVSRENHLIAANEGNAVAAAAGIYIN
jgi:hypothetical protein